MGSETTLIIRPIRGGPSLRKHARLECSGGVVTAVDRHGRTRTFDLSDRDGPYSFVWGDWEEEGNFALVDNAGQAVLLVDLVNWADEDMSRWQDATGIAGGREAARPNVHPAALSVFDPPYLKWAQWPFYLGAAGFGLWSVTHVNLIIVAVVVPALVIISICLVLARMSTPSRAELAEQARRLQANIDQLLIDYPELDPDNQPTTKEESSEPSPWSEDSPVEETDPRGS